MRKAKLLDLDHYLDNSWCYDGVSSCTIHYLTPSGRPKSKSKYGWQPTWEQAQTWLDGKYKPRLSNLFGLMFYIW